MKIELILNYFLSLLNRSKTLGFLPASGSTPWEIAFSRCLSARCFSSFSRMATYSKYQYSADPVKSYITYSLRVNNVSSVFTKIPLHTLILSSHLVLDAFLQLFLFCPLTHCTFHFPIIFLIPIYLFIRLRLLCKIILSSNLKPVHSRHLSKRYFRDLTLSTGECKFWSRNQGSRSRPINSNKFWRQLQSHFSYQLPYQINIEQ